MRFIRLTNFSKPIDYRFTCKDRFAYNYSASRLAPTTDYYARKFLKSYNRSLYKMLGGKSKIVIEQKGLDNFAKYFDDFNSSQKDVPNPRLIARDQVEQGVLKQYDIRKKVQEKFDHIYDTHTSLRDLSSLSSWEMVFEQWDGLDTSAGFTFPGYKKEEVIEECFLLTRNIAHRLKSDYPVYSPPCKCAFRGQLEDIENNKTRPVWVYPFEIVALERFLVADLQQTLSSSDSFMHFGPDAMPRLHKLLSKRSEGCLALTVDWKAFDSTIKSWLIEDAFFYLKRLIDFTKIKNYGETIHLTEAKAAQFERIWDFVKNYFINTKLMLPSGDVVKKNRGIPSGSYMTQMVGSVINTCVIQVLLDELGVKMVEHKVLGDDSYNLLVEQTIPEDFVNSMSSLAEDWFGMILHPDKLRLQRQWNDPKTFLGYEFRGPFLIRDRMKMLGSWLYTSDFVRTYETSVARLFAQMVLGGWHDPVLTQIWQQFTHQMDMRLTLNDLPAYERRHFKYVLHVDTNQPIPRLDYYTPQLFTQTKVERVGQQHRGRSDFRNIAFDQFNFEQVEDDEEFVEV